MAGLWILIGIVWFGNLPLRPLLDPDEGRYAEIPREMVASGDWVTPTLNGVKYFEKPPLQYWTTAVMYSVFGVSEWTSRAWAALLAFLCIPLVFTFARKLRYSRTESFTAAAILAINPYYLLVGQLNLLDQGFTFFASTAVFSFVVAQREFLQPRRSRSWMLLAWAALALAVLSKGIVVLVLGAMSLAIYLAITRDLSVLRRLHPATGLGLALTIAVPWFYFVQARNPEFSQFFFLHEHFERFFTQVHERVEPFWYFVPLLGIALLPFAGGSRHWTPAKIEGIRAPAEFRAELFLLIWSAVVVTFFSLSQSKLAPYILPAMPTIALVLARVTSADPRAFPRARNVSLSMLVLVAVGVLITEWKVTGNFATASVVWSLLIVAVCGICVAVDRARPDRPIQERWMFLAAIVVAGYQMLGMTFVSAFPEKSARVLTADLDPRIASDTPVYSVGQYRHSAAFYLHRPLQVYEYRGELEFGMNFASVSAESRNRDEFLRAWNNESRGIAFIDPKIFGALLRAGLKGRIVAQDARSIVVART